MIWSKEYNFEAEEGSIKTYTHKIVLLLPLLRCKKRKSNDFVNLVNYVTYISVPMNVAINVLINAAIHVLENVSFVPRLALVGSSRKQTYCIIV